MESWAVYRYPLTLIYWDNPNCLDGWKTDPTDLLHCTGYIANSIACILSLLSPTLLNAPQGKVETPTKAVEEEDAEPVAPTSPVDSQVGTPASRQKEGTDERVPSCARNEFPCQLPDHPLSSFPRGAG